MTRDAIDRVNASLADRITRAVGSMWCAYAFAILALLGLPAALAPGGMGPIAWFAQTFLQLVLLSILAVGQQVQSQHAAEHTERLDAHAERLDAIHEHLTKPTPPRTGRTRKETAP